jgi:hypothetical protein
VITPTFTPTLTADQGVFRPSPSTTCTGEMLELWIKGKDRTVPVILRLSSIARDEHALVMGLNRAVGVG